ncbi:MAG TPA: hypothetical protein VNA30_07025 [Mycobacteriales bacterium]|nr:hypothetical protein [Mycobacteriales bacterium]
MKQIRIQRTVRAPRRSDPAPSAVVPSRPASDTSAARSVLDRIDRLVGGR